LKKRHFGGCACFARYLRYHFAICERPDMIGFTHHSLDVFRKIQKKATEMQTLETERLILRKLKKDDFEAVHSYMSCSETGIYLPWGTNKEQEARSYIDLAMTESEKEPIFHYHYAAILKETGGLIGGCRVSCDGSLCWVLHRDHWNRGFGTEMGRAMMKYGFEELGLHRLFASCDTENVASYRLMEKLGMRREGTFLEYRPPNKLSGKKYSDCFIYAILKDEWETQKE